MFAQEAEAIQKWNSPLFQNGPFGSQKYLQVLIVKPNYLFCNEVWSLKFT